jgi:transcription elongation factor Elf1
LSGNHVCPVCGHEDKCTNTIIEPQVIREVTHNCGMCGSTWKERWRFEEVKV